MTDLPAAAGPPSEYLSDRPVDPNAIGRVDAVIVGAGPTGQAMALALAAMLGNEVTIALVDRAPVRPGGGSVAAVDPRVWALSAASVRFLDALSVWPAVVTAAQPVTEIDITDSRLDAGVRPVLLAYDNTTAEGEPAAWIVPNEVLRSALGEALARRPPGVVTAWHDDDAAVAGLEKGPAGRRLHLADGRVIDADVVIAADGRRSAIRTMAGIGTVRFDHDQLALVTTVDLERPHHGKAVQHFLPGGPFAILPLPGDRAAITWSEDRATAERILAADDGDFSAEVQRRFGGRLGRVTVTGPRAAFPLATEIARSFVAERLALVGDAAHGVHPIAGQGLNLAFRDCAALAECLADAAQAGLSLGESDALERYQRWRRFDATLSAGTFQALNRLFSNDVPLLRSAREVGLGIVDRSAALKRFFVREAAGLSGDLPALMR